MADPIDEPELKRREYELKRHDFLARIFDTHYSIALRLSTLCLTGNIAGVIAIWSALKEGKVPTEARFATGAFAAGIFLSVAALTNFCIAAGAVKTMWQTAAGRHFDPPAEFPTADESMNRSDSQHDKSRRRQLFELVLSRIHDWCALHHLEHASPVKRAPLTLQLIAGDVFAVVGYLVGGY